MKTYQFILTPIEKVFFGKEKHIIRQDYFVESNYTPQQTGVLGLTRHCVLILKDILDKPDEWEDNIGPKSFDGTSQDFGKIKKLYPVTIFNTNTSEHFYPYKNLMGLIKEVDYNVKVNYGNDTKNLKLLAKENNKKQENYFNAKNHEMFSNCFVKSDYSKQLLVEPKFDYVKTPNSYEVPLRRIVKQDGVFVRQEQSGITKNYNAAKKEDAYYKSVFFRMRENFSFSYFAEIDEEFDTKESLFMTFGAEASAYKIEIKEISDTKIITSNNSDGCYFHFLSDTLIEKEMLANCEIVICSTRIFRNLKTNAKDKTSLYNKDFNNKSDSLLFIEKGSIIKVAVKQVENFKDAIEAKTAYRNIGYNYYKQLNNLTI